MANGSKIDAFNSPSRRSQLDNLYHSSGDPDQRAAASKRRMETKAYRNDVRDTRSNDPQVRAAAYKRIAEKSAIPGFQAPEAIPTAGQYNERDRIEAEKTTAAGKRVSQIQDALLLEKEANKNAVASGAKAPVGGTNTVQGGTLATAANAPAASGNASPTTASPSAPTNRMSFADQEIEARQKSALSGAFGAKAKKDAEDLIGRQALFERMQNATPEERGGVLREEAKGMGISDEGYFRAQQKISGPVEMFGPPESIAEPPINQAKVNQASLDVQKGGIDFAINNFGKRWNDFETEKANKTALSEIQAALDANARREPIPEGWDANNQKGMIDPNESSKDSQPLTPTQNRYNPNRAISNVDPNIRNDIERFNRVIDSSISSIMERASLLQRFQV